MENFFYVIIAVVYLVYYLVRAANKNKAKQEDQQQSAPPPPPTAQPRSLAEQQAQRRDFEAAQREQAQRQNRQSQTSERGTRTNIPRTESTGKSVFDILRDELEGRQQPVSRPQPMDHDPFVEAESEVHPALKARREAAKLKEEKRTRDREHYSEKRLVEEFKRTHREGKQISHHTHDYFDEEKDGLKGKMQIKRAKAHPIKKLLKGKENVRNAIILKEILDKKF